MNIYLKSLFLITTTLSVVEIGSALAEDKLESMPTKFIEASGVKFSYRELGPKSGTPLIFLQHFTGTMDSWDPAVVNAFAKTRPVVVFNTKDVGATNGVVEDSIAQMTTDAKHLFMH